VPVCVAGSGPTLLAFDDGIHRIPDLGPGWRVLSATIDPTGTAVGQR
jgi:hypothetical protein